MIWTFGVLSLLIKSRIVHMIKIVTEVDFCGKPAGVTNPETILIKLDSSVTFSHWVERIVKRRERKK